MREILSGISRATPPMHSALDAFVPYSSVSRYGDHLYRGHNTVVAFA